MDLKALLLLFLLLSLAAPGWAQTKELPYPPCRSPVVELRVDTPTVKRGSAPAFTVVLRNEGKKEIRLVDIRRPEMSEVKFLRNGDELDLPVWSADPCSIDPRHDYLLLPAGREVRVTVANYNTDATRLLPDDYEVLFVFQNFPAPPNQKCASNRAKFSVR